MQFPQTPPTLENLLQDVSGNASDFANILTKGHPVDSKGRYLHWDDMRSRNPPDGLTRREWWLGTYFARRSVSRPLPLMGTNGIPFRFSNVDQVQERVHRIDQQASGQIGVDHVVTNLQSSKRYLVASLVEEAITSSQLEGASTTRRVAKELLATGRQPRDRSEQMIVNNYHAMEFAQSLAGQALTPAAVLDLHRIVADGTLDDPADAGRLQRPEDTRIGVYWHDNTLLHEPPPAAELPERLRAMCDFANGVSIEGFIHPVVRAIIVHFWMAYDHPFVDGNGRTARALFYWSMLRDDYWLAQYISVSSILRKAPVPYARSYLLVETDDNDLTYFVLYQLEVIERAIRSLHDYLARKMAEAREINELLDGYSALNPRQLAVVQDLMTDPAMSITIEGQARRHKVVYQSARTDLLALEELGLLNKQRLGKKFVFRGPADLTKRLRQLGGMQKVGR